MANPRSIKLAGPDRDGNFKVLSVKNTGILLPGDVCSNKLVTERILNLHMEALFPVDVIIVENKTSDSERFDLVAPTFSMESGGVVREELRGGNSMNLRDLIIDRIEETRSHDGFSKDTMRWGLSWFIDKGITTIYSRKDKGKYQSPRHLSETTRDDFYRLGDKELVDSFERIKRQEFKQM